MILGSPAPQFGQRCMSISTRLSSPAQLMRPGRTWTVSASPLQELQRAHHQVRGAVARWCLELELHLACIIELHSLVCQRRPGDGAAQLLQPLALVCFDPHGRVQTEAVDVGTQKLARHRAPQRQYLLPGALSRWRCGK